MVWACVGAVEQCVDSPERDDIDAEEETMVTAVEPSGCVCVEKMGRETVPHVPAGGQVPDVADSTGSFSSVCVTSPTVVRVVSLVDNGLMDGKVVASCEDVTG